MNKPAYESGGLPQVLTPCCGHLVDSASEIPTTSEGGRAPQAGDFSVCINCGTWLVFDDDHNLRIALPRDLDGVDSGFLKQLQRAQEYVRKRGPISGSSISPSSSSS